MLEQRTVFSPLQTPTAAFGIGGNNGSLDLGSLVDPHQTGLGPWRAFQHRGKVTIRAEVEVMRNRPDFMLILIGPTIECTDPTFWAKSRKGLVWTISCRNCVQT